MAESHFVILLKYIAGLVASQFLESNATQLTYHGLHLLMDSIPKGKLSVLFRNNHVSISSVIIEEHSFHFSPRWPLPHVTR
jgi:hypothetical protein